MQSDLQRIATVKLFLAIKHRLDQFAVGGVAFQDDAIQDQVRGTTGQTDFMAVVYLSAVISVWSSKIENTF